MQKQPARFTGRRENESSGSVLPKAQRGETPGGTHCPRLLLPAKESLAFMAEELGRQAFESRKQ